VSRFERSVGIRWGLRVLLALVATELSFRLVAFAQTRWLAGRAQIDGAIVCLGDSNTFGVGAPRGRSWPDQLRELLVHDGCDRPVANLALPGQSSAKAVDRLEERLPDGVPACVLLLAGVNDGVSEFDVDGLVERSGGAGRFLGGLLRASTTWRMLETGWHVLRGDLARPEFGAARRIAHDPNVVSLEDWPSELQHAREDGRSALFACLVKAWWAERADLASEAWRELAARPDFDALASRFLLPREAYEWELRWLQGETPPFLPLSVRKGLRGTYARFTLGCAALAEQQTDVARKAFARVAKDDDPRWQRGFVPMHVAWSLLLDRDWAAALAAFDAALADRSQRPAVPALAWLLAGGACCAALSSDTPSLASWQSQHAAGWRECFARSDPETHRLAREWALVADEIERRKTGGEPPAARSRASRLDAPATAALRWLLCHPEAPFDATRASLPLEPPRASWIGPLRLFLPPVVDVGLDERMAASCRRLAELSRRFGFRVVVVTYLDPALEPIDARLRREAEGAGWPLVDLPRRYDRAELEADAKFRYFSADHSHPNEAGYGLMASAVLEALRENGTVPPH
jgi:lysophospholipase L1-like esterase